MANLTGTASYVNVLRQLEATDPAHPNTWNPNYQTLINNDVFLKALIERLIKEHSHDGTASGGPKIPLANINVPVVDLGIVTQKILNDHINERNPHGTRPADMGAASSQELTAHKNEVATKTKAGHVMVGSGLSVDSQGKISVVAETPVSPIPSGLISLWSGAVNAVPSGWALCNGLNGTPNLVDRFVVGAGSKYNVGASGGEESVSLTTSQLPSHSHSSGSLGTDTTGNHSHTSGTLATSSSGAHSHSVSGSTSTDGSHTHTTYPSKAYDNVPSSTYGYTGSDPSVPMKMVDSSLSAAGSHSHTVSGTADSAGSHSHTMSGSTAASGSHSHSVSGSTGSIGSGQAHENRPPYYALAYIMKL